MLAGAVSASAADSADRFVRGIVRDYVTTQGLPYATVTVHPSGLRTVASADGIFELNLPEDAETLTAYCQGYAPRTVPVHGNRTRLYDICLTEQPTELTELVVKKKKYSKRNNPAVDFARSIRNARDLTDPRRNDYYSYDRYERISLGINNFDTTAQSALLKRLPFLIEHVDTSEISGQPVLNLSLKENASTVNWRKAGAREKTVVRGTRSNGIDEFVDQDNVKTMLDDLLREVDLYDNNIMLLRNTFVSPLSSLAPDFYRFYLVDSTAVVDGSDDKHIVLAFYPRNKASFGFSGHIYVPVGDTTMFIRKVDMKAPRDINLNFVDELVLSQSFTRAPDGSRLKETDRMIAVLKVLPHTPELYVSRKINLTNHSFDRPADADSLFGTLGSELVETAAASRDSLFWAGQRVEPEPPGESRADRLMARLRTRPLFYWGEKILKIIVSGYIPTGRDSKFDYGPVNTTASYNSLEGLRLRAGGMTTANLSKRWFGRAYVAYGFRDRKVKYYGEAEYSFHDKKYHSREFPVHSLRLSHKYDVDRLGSHYLYTNADNFVLSLARMSDRRFTYMRDTRLEYTLELANNLSFFVTAAHTRQEATAYVPFVTGAGSHLSHFDETALTVKLRFAPGEEFLQSKSNRYPVNPDAPVMSLSHTVALKGLGSRYTVNRTELSLSKRIRLSVLGSLDLAVNGGHVWGTAPFTDLLIPNANLSYTIQPQSFALMNPMEFINSSFVSWHATWQLRGALFNLVPGLRKLGLREVVAFNGLYGHRSEANNPDVTHDLLLFPENAGRTSMHRPYMEISAGLDNIFKVLRVDYVWRLSYLDVPYTIDRHGLRVALHFTF